MAARAKKEAVEKPFARELAFLRQQLELRIQPKKSMHALEEATLAEQVVRDPDRDQPLPRGIRKAIQEHQKALDTGARQGKSAAGPYTHVKHMMKAEPLGRSTDAFEIFLRGLETIRPQLGHPDQTSVLSVDPVGFTNPVSEGATETREGNYLRQLDYKTALSKVGYADLDGPNAQAWNRTVFGFVSVFTLPGPGKQNTVSISSHLNASFVWPEGWIEALSFGKKAWSEVTANAQMDVLVASTAFRDGVYTFLHGESPRGNWNEGEIGVYNPTDIVQAVDLNVQFTTTNPANTTYQVTVFELAEFIAERHHRVDRCEAAIWGTCKWDPLQVGIVTHG